nr:uncharacterized protein LOC121829580 isoform X3 [Peromyscus maniculatus bairdii]
MFPRRITADFCVDSWRSDLMGRFPAGNRLARPGVWAQVFSLRGGRTLKLKVPTYSPPTGAPGLPARGGTHAEPSVSFLIPGSLDAHPGLQKQPTKPGNSKPSSRQLRSPRSIC